VEHHGRLRRHLGIDERGLGICRLKLGAGERLRGQFLRLWNAKPGKLHQRRWQQRHAQRGEAKGLSQVFHTLSRTQGELPIVETDRTTLMATDFAAFRPLFDLPLGMTAHVVYTAIDALAPATTSVTLVRDVIRDWLGFRGLLMSDDISMGALTGSIEERSRSALTAGCDVVLHCNGKFDEMREVAAAVPHLAGEAAVRAEVALSRRTPPARPKPDLAALRAEFAALLAESTPHEQGAVT